MEITVSRRIVEFFKISSASLQSSPPGRNGLISTSADIVTSASSRTRKGRTASKIRLDDQISSIQFSLHRTDVNVTVKRLSRSVCCSQFSSDSNTMRFLKLFGFYEAPSWFCVQRYMHINMLGCYIQGRKSVKFPGPYTYSEILQHLSLVQRGPHHRQRPLELSKFF